MHWTVASLFTLMRKLGENAEAASSIVWDMMEHIYILTLFLTLFSYPHNPFALICSYICFYCNMYFYKLLQINFEKGMALDN